MSTLNFGSLYFSIFTVTVETSDYKFISLLFFLPFTKKQKTLIKKLLNIYTTTDFSSFIDIFHNPSLVFGWISISSLISPWSAVWPFFSIKMFPSELVTLYSTDVFFGFKLLVSRTPRNLTEIVLICLKIIVFKTFWLNLLWLLENNSFNPFDVRIILWLF